MIEFTSSSHEQADSPEIIFSAKQSMQDHQSICTIRVIACSLVYTSRTLLSFGPHGHPEVVSAGESHAHYYLTSDSPGIICKIALLLRLIV